MQWFFAYLMPEKMLIIYCEKTAMLLTGEILDGGPLHIHFNYIFIASLFGKHVLDRSLRKTQRSRASLPAFLFVGRIGCRFRSFISYENSKCLDIPRLYADGISPGT